MNDQIKDAENKMIYTERANLFEPNAVIHFCVRISGNPSVEALEASVLKAFEANEVTMSKIVLDQKGNACYQKLNKSACKAAVRETDFLTLIRIDEKVRFQIERGELVRVYIIPGREESSLLIMAHHIAMDGKSILYFVEDIMNALSGKSLAFKPLNVFTEKSLKKLSRLPAAFKLYADYNNKSFRQDRKVFQWEDLRRLHAAYREGHSSQILYERFSEQEVEQLCQSAKRMKISVNSFITTAFLKADLSNHTVGLAANARLDANKCLSNQATGISIDYTYSLRQSFEKNAGTVHHKIMKKLKKPVMKYFILQFMPLFDPCLIDSILFYTYGQYFHKTTQKLARVMGYAGGKTRELGITNLTRLDIPEQYGRYGLKDGIFIPPVVSYAKHIVGVLTMEDGMSVCHQFMEEQNVHKETEFFRRAVSYIRQEISR